MTRLAAALVALCALMLSPLAGAQSQLPREEGYIEMPDGVGLKYAIDFPEGAGPFPVLLQYQGYGAGGDPNDNGISLIAPRLRAAGFAILGVSLRGTGCSEGSFDLFEDRWVADGLEVIRWAATRPWSNGDLAMIGLSFPGMTQMMVGPMREPAVKALLPWSAMTDLYRDVGYPGGIFNLSFATAWTGIQKTGWKHIPTRLQAGDTRCAAAFAGQNDPERIVFLFGQTHPWADNSVYERYVPEGSIGRINVPTFLSHAWQDEQISSRVSVDYEQLDPGLTWMVYGNGAHGFGLGMTAVLDGAEAFLRHFLKGEDNGFPDTPRVQVLHEVAFGAEPRWISRFDGWPAPTRAAELYLTAGGALEAARPGTGGTVAYAYPLPAPSMAAAAAAQQENQAYQLPVPPGGAAVFTTAALAHDLQILGSIRADLWLSSTATDTDVQLSLTELRPDGSEQFVQRGWLRASRRQQDLRQARLDQPWHTHAEADALPLEPGEPTLLNIEILAVGHTFRAGSALRLSVEAPVGTTGFRQLEFNPVPAINTVHVGGATLSRLVLPVLPGAAAPVALHDCVGMINQPCRRATGAMAPGALAVPAAAAAELPLAGAAAVRAPGVVLRNQSGQAHYLRAVTLQFDDAPGLFEAAMTAAGTRVAIREPFERSRFELPEVVLEPGAELALPVELSRAAAAAGLASVAHAAGGGAAPAAAGLLPIAWLMLLPLYARRRSLRLGALLVAAGLLAGCGASGTPAVDARGAPGYRVVAVEVVDAAGTYQRYAVGN